MSESEKEGASPPNSDGSPPAPPTSTSKAPASSGAAPDNSPPAPPTDKASPPKSSPAPNGSPPTKNAPSPKSSTPGSGNSSPTPSGGSTTNPGKQLSPPSSNNNGQHTKSSSSSSGSNDNDVKAGFIVGGVLLFGLIIMVIVCVSVSRRKKKKKNDYTMDYYRRDDRPHPQGNSQYYNRPPPPPQHSNWNNNGQDHIIGMTAGGQGSGPGGWGAPSPPSHRMNFHINSSGMESGPQRPVLPPPSPYGTNKNTFSYDELAIATGNFAQENMIGQGGFGYVYKGVLPNGKEIAVKSLKSGSGQGEREFQAEVDIISRVHHRYLVSLVGHCIAGGQRMLVYEFVPNDSLEHHLHGKGLPIMDFSTRLKIALGSAKGLAYLHEDCHPKIIHRDIKSANILLDFSFEAKVADFGLAKLSSDNYTHVSTRVMGTFGYLAPEYAASGKLTEKSDVFSFGVMLLELITGKRPIDPHSSMDETLVDWARPLMTRSLEDGNYDELADPLLERNYNTEEMARIVACAAASIRHSAKKRPKMSQIVRALEGESSLEDLNEGVKPGHSTIYGSTGSSEYSQKSYQSDLKKFKQMLSSTELPTTNELGSSDSREMPPRQH
ncbi:hypothetical protein ACFE04_023663 [Oxalis oulophora]